jgi:hypothetical protein
VHKVPCQWYREKELKEMKQKVIQGLTQKLLREQREHWQKVIMTGMRK